MSSPPDLLRQPWLICPRKGIGLLIWVRQKQRLEHRLPKSPIGMLDWDNTSIVFTKRTLVEFLKFAILLPLTFHPKPNMNEGTLAQRLIPTSITLGNFRVRLTYRLPARLTAEIHCQAMQSLASFLRQQLLIPKTKRMLKLVCISRACVQEV